MSAMCECKNRKWESCPGVGLPGCSKKAEPEQCDDCHAPKGTVCGDMDCPGKRAQTGKLEHVPFANCWCEPVADYTDPDTGITVWVHMDVH